MKKLNLNQAIEVVAGKPPLVEVRKEYSAGFIHTLALDYLHGRSRVDEAERSIVGMGFP